MIKLFTLKIFLILLRYEFYLLIKWLIKNCVIFNLSNFSAISNENNKRSGRRRVSRFTDGSITMRIDESIGAVTLETALQILARMRTMIKRDRSALVDILTRMSPFLWGWGWVLFTAGRVGTVGFLVNYRQFDHLEAAVTRAYEAGEFRHVRTVLLA